jgi:hypothetical protein
MYEQIFEGAEGFLVEPWRIQARWGEDWRGSSFSWREQIKKIKIKIKIQPSAKSVHHLDL